MNKRLRDASLNEVLEKIGDARSFADTAGKIATYLFNIRYSRNYDGLYR